MNRRLVSLATAVAVGVVALAAVAVLGFGGVAQTVVAGTQTQVCGRTLGVSVDHNEVNLIGVTTPEGPLTPGDRARVHALCVVEVVSVTVTSAGGDNSESGIADGGITTVELRWRLW